MSTIRRPARESRDRDQALAQKDQALAEAVLEHRRAVAEREAATRRLSELEAELKRRCR